MGILSVNDSYSSWYGNVRPAGPGQAQGGSFHGGGAMAAGSSGISDDGSVVLGGAAGRGALPEDGVAGTKRDIFPQEDKAEKKGRLGTDDPKEECETCKRRKYKDGSDEMVSFKSPQHVSPERAASAVRAHEQEHVSNAYKKAAMNDGKVVSASVSIHMGICPECGRTYVAGGTTHTQIKYYNEENPYQKGLKTADRAKYEGLNLDYAV